MKNSCKEDAAQAAVIWIALLAVLILMLTS